MGSTGPGREHLLEERRPSGPRSGGERDRSMDLLEALYTRRMMRRLRPDPIPLDAQARILDAAIRASMATGLLGRPVRDPKVTRRPRRGCGQPATTVEVPS